jgi:hypothetical protein
MVYEQFTKFWILVNNTSSCYIYNKIWDIVEVFRLLRSSATRGDNLVAAAWAVSRVAFPGKEELGSI